MKISAVQMPRPLAVYLLGTLTFIIVLLPFHAFFSTWGGSAVGPLELWKSWKEILLLPAIGLTIIWALWARVAGQLLRDPIVALVVVFALLVLLLAPLGRETNGDNAMLAGLAFDLRYLVMWTIAYVVARYSDLTQQVWRHAQVFLIATGTLLAVVGLLQVTVIPREFLTQFGYEKFVTIAPYLTIDEKSPDIIRAFATLRGPNDYGAYLVMKLAVTLTAAINLRYRLGLGALMAAGIFASHSRSAYIAAAIVVALWAGMIIGWRRMAKYWYVGVFLIAAAVGFVATAFLSPTVRLIVFHSSEYDTHLTEGSIDDRSDAIIDAAIRTVERPFGCGAGCSGPASYYGDDARISENYYLQIAEQHGFLGIAIWLAAFVLVLRRLYQAGKRDTLTNGLFIGGVGLSVIGLLLHVWVDDPLSMTWWALAGAALGLSAVVHQKKSPIGSKSKK